MAGNRAQQVGIRLAWSKANGLFRLETPMITDSIRQALEVLENDAKTLAESLERAGDEARVQLHLGLLEIEERWEKARAALEAELFATKRLVRIGAQRARVQAHLGRLEADDALETLRTRAAALRKRIGAAVAAVEA